MGSSAPLPDQIVRIISDAVISGEFREGERLREAELAARFGVSRAPLREAMRLLEERRLIERLPYAGVRVVPLTVRMVSELYEIRAALEEIVCRRAAVRITDAEIAELTAMLEAERSALPLIERDRQSRPLPIRDFHARLAQIADNSELQRLLATDLWRRARGYYSRVWSDLEDRTRQAFFEHSAILDALRQRDGELAALLMRRHIERSRSLLEQQIARSGASGSDGARS